MGVGARCTGTSMMNKLNTKKIGARIDGPTEKTKYATSGMLTYASGRWRIETSEGDQGEFDVVITATGILHHPVYPDIAGVKDFKGVAFHSSRWDHSVSLKGKRVGIIGTGSTAVQILPAIVDEVAKVSPYFSGPHNGSSRNPTRRSRMRNDRNSAPSRSRCRPSMMGSRRS